MDWLPTSPFTTADLHPCPSARTVTASSSTAASARSATTTNATASPSSATTATAAIERRLRDQILHHVAKLIQSTPPSRQALHQLLRFSSPATIRAHAASSTSNDNHKIHHTTNDNKWDNPVAREKAFRQLKAKLHPDKHPTKDASKVTELFQNVQHYYVECCHAMNDEGTVGSNRYKRSTNTTTGSTTSTNTSTSTSSGCYQPGGQQQQQHHVHNAAASSASSFKYDATPTSRTPSPDSVVIVNELDVFMKWPFLKCVPYRETPYQAVSDVQLQYHLGYACLNLRGAICHKQTMDCTYQLSNMDPTMLLKEEGTSIVQVWQQAGFAASDIVTLHSNIDAMKQQILIHGPIVSTSFFLDPNYYNHHHRQQQQQQQQQQQTNINQPFGGGNFSERHVNKHHPLLIVGWTMLSQGPVWRVQALRGPTFHVGMGQFGIEDTCVAPPPEGLECKSWQSPGPYWDVTNIADKCLEWKEYFDTSITTTTSCGGGGIINNNNNSSSNISSSSSSSNLLMLQLAPLSSMDIENLMDLWTDGVGICAIVKDRRTFVLRDATKQAQSRKVILRDVARVPNIGSNNSSTSNIGHHDRAWKVTLSVIRR